MNDIVDGPPPPGYPASNPAPPSLLERIEALERLCQAIQDMMNRDREFMNDLRQRIGL